jgi:hypothetical protein
MAALGQDLQISKQMPSAFAALARKYQVPGAQFAIYHGDRDHDPGSRLLVFQSGLLGIEPSYVHGWP